MASEEILVNGPYRVDALGAVTLISRGSGTLIRAAGDTSDISLEANGTTSITCGPAWFGLANKGPTEGHAVTLAGANGKILQIVGPPLVGAAITLEAAKITLSVGPPGVGASIELTPVGITLKVAQTCLKLTPTGISEEILTSKREVTPIGHTMKAAETKFEVAVQGISESGPIKQEKFDAVVTSKQTLNTEDTSAMRSIKAGILMVG